MSYWVHHGDCLENDPEDDAYSEMVDKAWADKRIAELEMEATLTFENDVVVKCPFVSQCHLVAQFQREREVRIQIEVELRERIAELERKLAAKPLENE